MATYSVIIMGIIALASIATAVVFWVLYQRMMWGLQWHESHHRSLLDAAAKAGEKRVYTVSGRTWEKSGFPGGVLYRTLN